MLDGDDRARALCGVVAGLRDRAADRGEDVTGSDDVNLEPYRHLALRVLTRALQDLNDPGGSATDRASARAFFAGSSMLQHWCRVAAIDPSSIAKQAARR
jgi:hypothetical protein